MIFRKGGAKTVIGREAFWFELLIIDLVEPTGGLEPPTC